MLRSSLAHSAPALAAASMSGLRALQLRGAGPGPVSAIPPP